ncbi:uncharacterized protein IAS62_000251 [Cryptococcus decagattii]|uniref:Protein CPL1-like domain-containing protein n=1 Tax=Cryptococcus decagattii TaxID=1859122 RepID=A0ABZ2AP59_9TREE
MVSVHAFTLILCFLASDAYASPQLFLEGCLKSNSTPANSLAISATSPSQCAIQCWSQREDTRYAYWDSLSDNRCLCSPFPANAQDFTLNNNEDKASEICAEGTAVYVRAPEAPNFQVERKREGKGRLVDVSLRAEGLCPTPLTACSVAGNTSIYECLDLNVDMSSCGGCVNGIFGSIKRANSAVDCTSLPGVALNAATCLHGQCRAFRCDSGYTLTNDHACVADS